jgi:hypothetical protein
MGISAGKLTQDNPVAQRVYEYSSAPAINLTNVAIVRIRPGFDGEVVAVRANARTVNAYSVPEVRIVDAAANTGQNVLAGAITPTAVASASPAAGALQATRALRRFTANQEILLHVTTGATAPVDPRIEIVVRPFPLNGEAR